MKLTLEPTDRIERVRDTPCRVWTGTTDVGTPVLAWVATVQPQTHDPDCGEEHLCPACTAIEDAKP